MTSLHHIVLMLLLCLPAAGRSQGAEGRETVNVAVLEDWPPYYVLSASGEPDGFAVQTFEAIAARAQLTPTYRVYRTFPEMLAALAAGEVDVIPNVGIVDGREALYTTTVDTFSIGFFTRSSTPGTPGPDEVSGSIGVVSSNIGELLAEANLDESQIVVFGSVREALFRLIAGETDGLVYPSPVVWSLAREARLEDRIKETRSGLAEVRRAIGVAADRGDLVPRLNAAIEPFIVSEEYARLQEAWISPPPAYWTVQRVVVACLAALALILIVLVAWRVVERTRMTRELLHREKELQDLFDSIRDAIVVADSDRRIVDMNPAAVALFGYELEELRGKQTELLYARGEDFTDVGDKLAGGGDQSGFVAMMHGRTRDGRVFVGEISAYCQSDEEGRPVRFIGLIRDVTRRLEEERKAEQLQQQLAQAQKMESMGQLAGGIAHDFNNMLTVIQGYLALVLGKLEQDHPLREYLLEVREAANRSTELTRQILGFARRQTRNPEVIDLNGAMSKMLPILRRLVTEEVKLLWTPCSEPLSLRIDPSQVDQILANLVVNARDAIKGSGTIAIETAEVSVDTDFVSEHPDARPGEYAMISVRDDGCGIPEQVRPHVFEPFVTTKPTGEGTGLGLATVHGIVQQNGGFIEIDSEEGAGTTFRVFLPRHSGEAESRADTKPSYARDGNELVLLVEDDPAVLRVTARMLEGLGYRTVPVGSSEEALDLVADDGHKFQLLITDIIMPEMNGRELASRIRERIPQLPVLFVSGYSHDVVGELEGDKPEFRILQKPFTPEELNDEIRAILDGPRHGSLDR